MGCKKAGLPEPLFKKCSDVLLTSGKSTRKSYHDILYLFRALDLDLRGNDKLFATYLQNMEDVDAAEFQDVSMSDIPTVEDLNKTNIFL